MKLNIFYLFVIILTLSNFNKILGEDLNQAEFNCLFSLANKYQDITILNSLNTPSTFCSLGTKYGVCINGSVTDLTFRPTIINVAIEPDELKCLPFLGSLSLINANANPSILQTNSYNTKLKKIKLTSYVPFNIDFEIGNLDSFDWGNNQTTHTSTITPFALKNVKSFYSSTNVNLIQGTNTDYVNNYTTLYGGYSDNMPDLINMIKVSSVSIRPGSTFNETSFINLYGYSKTVKSISISSSVTIRFPYELASGIPRDTVYISADGLKAPSSLIDLSNIPYISMFQILKMGQDFNYQGNFPFSKLPLKCGNIQFFKGNTPNVNWKIFENVTGTMLQDLKITTPFPSSNPFSPLVTSFDVSQNQITGQVDESWCSVLLIVNKNLLTGKIPNCFYCYLNLQSTGYNFGQNNFDNYNTTNNKCGYDIIVPYINYNKTSTLLTLRGKNLGWEQNNFKTSTCIIVKSDGFIVVGCTGTYTNVTFVNQNLNFTLSLDRTEPIINNVIQSNNTFIISGSYFAYEPSIINVTIGESPLKCEFTNSSKSPTFYSIQCDIEYPVIEYGLKNLRVQVNSLVSKPYEFNLDYTKIPCPISDCNGNGICNDHIGVCECFNDWKTIDDDICTVAIHYLSAYSQTSDIEGGIINLYGFFGDVHNGYKVLIDGIQCGVEVLPTSTVYTISVGSGKIGTNSSIEIIQNGLSFHGTIYPYENLIKECPSNCNNNGQCNTTTGECTCNTGFIGVDCIQLTNYTLPNITSSIVSNVGLLFKSEQTVFITSFYSFIEIDYTGTKTKAVTIDSWKTEIINNQAVKYIGSSSSNSGAVFEITFLKVPKNQQFSFAGNEFNIGAGGIKMSISVSNYTYSNQSNYLIAAMQAKAESDPSSPIQNKCNNGTIVITSQSNSNLTLNNYNYFTISKDSKRLSIRLQDKLISDSQPTFMVNQLNFKQPDQSLLFGMSLPHCGKQCSIDGPDFIVTIESDYKILNSCSPKPTSKPISSSEEQPSSSLKQQSLISSILIIILISLIILN
ncbi:hypothetical protein ACTFIZ_004978 [Dictyostelium cf. discoideum]